MLNMSAIWSVVAAGDVNFFIVTVRYADFSYGVIFFCWGVFPFFII